VKARESSQRFADSFANLALNFTEDGLGDEQAETVGCAQVAQAS
jgi:hypothetical protein